MVIPLQTFLERLTQSQLLTTGEIDQFLSSFSDDRRPANGEQLAQELVREKKLTSYQAQSICSGTGTSLTLGNYRILDKLGRGGMGDVFKAEHRRMKRVVALKVVKPEILDSPISLKRFQREVETVARLDHPNIVTAHDADEAQGINFLVMQFVDGRDLSSTVRERGPLSIAKAVDCVLQAARGLSYAHEQGITHRDVKPANLLLDKKGAVKILDLGLATLSSKGARAESLTGSEMIVGTLDYMAPEQAHSPKLADHRSDIYSLGMTLYFLLTSRPAYEAESVVEKLLAHREQPAPSLVGRSHAPSSESDTFRDLDPIFQKMVAKQPAERYQSMREVIAALEDFQQRHQDLLSPPKPGSTDATAHWVRPSGGNLTQRHGGTEGKSAAVANALLDEQAAAGDVEQTASNLSPQTDTTAVRRKPATITAQLITPYACGLALTITVSATALLLISTGLWFSGNPLKRRGWNVASAVVDSSGEKSMAPPAPNLKSQIPNPKSAPPPLAIAPFDAAQARAHQEAWASYLGVPVEQTNSIGMKLRLIPPGEFMMGSTPEQIEEALNRSVDPKVAESLLFNVPSEAPQHRVTVSKPVFFGATEVTVGQFRTFIESSRYVTETEKRGGGRHSFQGDPDPTLSWKAPGYAVLDDTPVTQVTWNDAIAFCNWLSEQDRLKSSYSHDAQNGWVLLPGTHGYRLPTEAEWEHSCRAGTTTHYFFGNDEADLPQHAVFSVNSGRVPGASASKSPNAFGLFEMPGNVTEWCQDWSDLKWYENSPSLDPSGPASGSTRVFRGGHWASDAVQCRSAHRSSGNPLIGIYRYGFRAVRTLALPSANPKSEIPNPKSASAAGFALEFNGKNSYVDLPTVRYDGSYPITVEATIIINSVELGGTVFGDRRPRIGGLSLAFPSLDPSKGTGQLGQGTLVITQSNQNLLILSEVRLSAGQAIHVAATINGSSGHLFVNGKLQATQELTGTYLPASTAFVIGAGPAQARNHFSGIIDEVRYSKTARYSTDFTPLTRFEPDTDTLALYHFDEGAGDIPTDSSGNNHHGKIINAQWVPGIAAGPVAGK